MDKKEIFNKIDNVIDEAFVNLNESKKIRNEYEKIGANFDEDIIKLKKMIKDELVDCYKNIKIKENNIKQNNQKKVIYDTDNKKYDIFVIIPIFNASDKQAEDCICSVIDNFIGNNYKILIMTNRKMEFFESDYFKNIPHYIVMKNLFSLPEAYNELVNYAKIYQKDNESIISLMDDDAYILTSQEEKIKRNIYLLKKDKYIAISGHYYDISPCKSDFQKMVNVTHTYKFSKEVKKPYCHGGACFLIKIKNFPHTGLPLSGLGGISINILEINNRENNNKWFLYNNHNLAVFHPRKMNLFAWITTYLSYEIAWNNTLENLDKEKESVWRKELNIDSGARVEKLYKLLNKNNERIFVLGNIYLTRYLKPLLRNNIDYKTLKKFNVNTHINLE